MGDTGPGRIEDYALLSDLRTAALVGRDGSIDWLCMPRFDSPSCFSRLLGTEDDGHWRIAPTGEVVSVRRSYRDGSLVLETEFETVDGVVRLIDTMPPEQDDWDADTRVGARAGGRGRAGRDVVAVGAAVRLRRLGAVGAAR
ncbi:trehalase-like domain-containing protein [Saccharothrix luteola]|uniref:trehalase-like domain-containing protein n=1 Tax=Saccharothrix luteola TaxID=2893018 RepID=UPI001E4FD0E7|nr:trehalase-like domain-containing protein [Saccharothrix luteola]MCC8249004.1 DUF5911 domain-containing protein [Saccharothrix luteola]